MSVSLISSLIFLVFVALILCMAAFHYLVAVGKLRVSAYLLPEAGKKLREEAKRDVIRATLGLLIVLATFVCAYTLHRDLSIVETNLQLQTLRAETPDCTPTDAVTKKGRYIILDPCIEAQLKLLK